MTPAPDFRALSYAQEVIFGAGSLAQLGPAVERFGWQRLLLCTSASANRLGQAAQVEQLLGQRWRATFAPVKPHVPETQVLEALALAAQHAVDAVIGLGGGSPIGLAKAVAQRLDAVKLDEDGRRDQSRVPVIAIPTTYAGSEMTSTYGVTRQKPDGEWMKITVTDPKVSARLVIYDPELTLDLPPDLSASTGLNALAHCVEAIYSPTRNPLSTAAALSGLRAIAEALPRCHAAPRDLAARTDMLAGAYLAGASLSSTAMALHHGVCHVLGGTAGVPHGIANSIILPHAMRYNAAMLVPPPPGPAWGELVAAALGLPPAPSPQAAALAAADFVYALISRLGLPQHLRQTSVLAADLPHLAQLAFDSRTVQNNPKPIPNAAALEALLRAAW